MSLTNLLLLMMEAYHLCHWDSLYETAETRRVRTLTYYSKPNKLVGEGLGHMMMQPDGLQLFGAWAFLEALASTAPQGYRGWLVRNGTPMDASRIAALLPRVDVSVIERTLTFFSTPPMDWLERKPWPVGHTHVMPGAISGRAHDTPGAPATRGKIDRERNDDTPIHTHNSAPRGPTVSEVRNWAIGEGIDPEFAELKFSQASERKDFEKLAWCQFWPSKFSRFWKEDGPMWKVKNEKIARPDGKPAGWQPGDQETWWTDPVSVVKGALQGACQLKEEQTAARLRQIIVWREGKR